MFCWSRRTARKALNNRLLRSQTVTHHHRHHQPLHLLLPYSTVTESTPTNFVSTTEVKLRDVLSSIVNVPTKAADTSHADLLHELAVLLLGTSHNASAQAWEESCLVLKLRELQDSGLEEVEEQARSCLALLGHAPPFTGRGLRILSIDGGGTRGLIPIIILRHLEEICGQPIHALFDFVCGTSTGCILASLLCLEKLSANECKKYYFSLSHDVFKMNNLLGMSQLFLNHAFYDSKLLQKQIRHFGSLNSALYKTSGQRHVPRMCFVSTIANQPVVAPYLFCNYKHRPSRGEGESGGGENGGGESRKGLLYQHNCDVQCWEAILASTAAPGFFEEVKLGNYIFLDGGILTNNPCGIAIHEARLLWGAEAPIQTVVSLGTGLHYNSNTQATRNTISSTSIKEKIIKVVGGATDTESVHTILKDVYHPSVYFRFQPNLTEDIAIDESKPAKLDLLCEDAERFIVEHGGKLEETAASLMAKKRPHQRVHTWLTSNWDKLSSLAHYSNIKHWVKS